MVRTFNFDEPDIVFPGELLYCCRRYDLILMDQMMPGMNGVETLGRIRERFDMRGVSVLALTADAITGAREYYLEQGFDDYLSKPVKAEELERALATYLPKQLLLSEADIRRVEAAERQRRRESPVVRQDGEPSGEDARGERSAGGTRHIVVVDPDAENLRRLKQELAGVYDGTFVTDREKAEKYLSRHDDAYVLVNRELFLNQTR